MLTSGCQAWNVLPVYRALADEPSRAADFDAALDDLAGRHGLGEGGTSTPWGTCCWPPAGCERRRLT